MRNKPFTICLAVSALAALAMQYHSSRKTPPTITNVLVTNFSWFRPWAVG